MKQENKLTYLLECLQKTPPPVLIFAENKNDVDDIHEQLLTQVHSLPHACHALFCRIVYAPVPSASALRSCQLTR